MTTVHEQDTAQGHVAPLAPAQFGIWAAAQMSTDTLYTIPFALVLDGLIDELALVEALDRVVGRHEVLRTAVRLRDGEPVQVVCRPPHHRLGFRSEPGDGTEAEVRRLLRAAMQEPFDLAEGGLLRVQAVQFSDTRRVLVCTAHHLCFDGTSIGLFAEELSARYDEALNGRLTAPAAELQYADLAQWQVDRLADGTWADQRAFWERRLSDTPEASAPPPDRQPTASAEGATIELTLPDSVGPGLDRLAESTGTSRFMVVLAALYLLLHRGSGQHTIAVGTPVAQRGLPETTAMIGPLLNTLVLTADVGGAGAVHDLLARTRDVVLDSFDHQDLPFETVLRLGSGGTSRPGLFDVMLNYEPPGPRAWSLDGATMRLIDCPDEEVKVPIAVYVRDGASIRLRVSYRTAAYTPARMTAWTAQLAYLLETLPADPERALSGISLVPATPGVLPDPAAALIRHHQPTVVDLIRTAARRSPDATALQSESQTMSYRELLEAADDITARLCRHGVGRGDVIGVVGGRCAAMVTVMVATMSAGAVFMPIDDRLPEGRRQDLLQRGAAAAIVTLGRDAPHGDLTVTLSTGVKRDSTGRPDHPPAADDAAYLYFTSGTTGRPKAVLGRHDSLAHFVRWESSALGVGPGDRVSQLTTVSFDPFLRDVLLPLTSGATLCIPSEETVSDPDRLWSWMQTAAVTVMHAVPSLVKWWLTAAGDARLDRLRLVLFAGEPLSASLVRRFRDRTRVDLPVVNLYGPTETTLAKCFHPVLVDADGAVLPVGRPIPDTQALVLTASGQLCGVGETGEICIRTPFHALSGDPEAPGLLPGFERNPYTGDPGDVFYRTGDLGRYRADGDLEILGRRDHQIKIHGSRIAPNEIVEALAQHPGVEAVAVRDWTNDEGDVRLAAYVVPGDCAVDETTLRRWAAERLPRVMVPTDIMLLEQLPLTPNGKIDRNRLPSPAPSPGPGRRPATPAEERLCALFGDVLGRPPVPVDQDFFSLGGHSLLVTRLVGRVQAEFGVRLPFAAVFDRPTVAELAPWLAGAATNEPAEPPAGTAPDRAAVDRLDDVDDLDGIDDDEADLLASLLHAREDQR